jgi:hypothetical protein
MPDDFDAPTVSGREERENTQEFYALCAALDIPVENPWIPDIFDYSPERLERERDLVREAVRRASFAGQAPLFAVIRSHIGSRGNWKLPKKYLTFNMTCAHECPSLAFRSDGTLDMSRTTCQAFTPDGELDCYAIRDEQHVKKKAVWPYRIRQQELWRILLKKEPELFVEVIHNFWGRGREMRTALRFSVAGDFPDQKSVDAFLYIAERLGSTMPVPKSWGLPFITYTYTARRRFNYRAAEHVPAAVIMGSNFKKAGISAVFEYITDREDSPEEEGAGSRYGDWPTREWSRCHGDLPHAKTGAKNYGCRGCRRCILGLNSVVVRHGQRKPLNRATYYPKGWEVA